MSSEKIVFTSARVTVEPAVIPRSLAPKDSLHAAV
jgi:hypothetical protein